MFGNTTPCVDRARGVLTDHGYEVLVFHATGIGGRTMEGMIAAAANASTGPVVILLPLGGVSMLDSEGCAFWDPEADRACYEAIKDNLKSGIDVLKLAHNINDPPFADRAAEVLLGMLGQ